MAKVIHKKVLVVDDEAEARDLYKDFLDEMGLESLEASGPEQAMKIIEAEQPLLILLDIRMRTPDAGIVVLKWIRENKFKTRVIMVSAIQEREVYDEVMKLGADDFLSKPFDPDQFTKTVTNHMDAIVQQLEADG
jgi:DNA-binding NtrC family response regulator